MQITVHGQNFTQVRGVLFGGAQGTRCGSSRRDVHRSGPVPRLRHRARPRLDRHRCLDPHEGQHVHLHPADDDEPDPGLRTDGARRNSAYQRGPRPPSRRLRGARRAWVVGGDGDDGPAPGPFVARPALLVGRGQRLGPTTGVCSHNGGDLDCHIVGFDCSGLAMYAWWPYRHLAHYAATQYSRPAGSTRRSVSSCRVTWCSSPAPSRRHQSRRRVRGQGHGHPGRGERHAGQAVRAQRRHRQQRHLPRRHPPGLDGPPGPRCRRCRR